MRMVIVPLEEQALVAKFGDEHWARRIAGLHKTWKGNVAGVEVRSRDPDASDAGRFGERASELERHLHSAGRSLRIFGGGRAHSHCRPAHGN